MIVVGPRNLNHGLRSGIRQPPEIRKTAPGVIPTRSIKRSRPVSRVLSKSRQSETRDGHSSGTYVAARLKLPTQERRGPRHSSSIWNCSRWGLAGRAVANPPVRSYRTISPLPVSRRSETIGGIFSVPLSVGSPRLRVTKHPALWSSDFPRPPKRRPRPSSLLKQSIPKTQCPVSSDDCSATMTTGPVSIFARTTRGSVTENRLLNWQQSSV